MISLCCLQIHRNVTEIIVFPFPSPFTQLLTYFVTIAYLYHLKHLVYYYQFELRVGFIFNYSFVFSVTGPFMNWLFKYPIVIWTIMISLSVMFLRNVIVLRNSDERFCSTPSTWVFLVCHVLASGFHHGYEFLRGRPMKCGATLVTLC